MKTSISFFSVILIVLAMTFFVSMAQDAKKPAQEVQLTKDDVRILIYFSVGAQFSGGEVDAVAPVLAKLRMMAADTSKQVKPIALTMIERNVLNAVIDRSELKRKLNDVE